MLTISQIDEKNVLSVQVMDHLIASDYEILASKTEEMLSRFDRINLLVELRDFKGWSVGSLWQDLKFDIRHFSDIGKLAIVGEKSWEKGLAFFSKPFTKADVQYFDATEFEEAKRWVQE